MANITRRSKPKTKSARCSAVRLWLSRDLPSAKGFIGTMAITLLGSVTIDVKHLLSGVVETNQPRIKFLLQEQFYPLTCS